MKFKTSIQEINNCLNVLSSITSYNSATLSYRYIKISGAKNVVEFKAFDDYTIGSYFVDVYDNEGEDTVYVLAKHLISLIGSFQSGEVVFDFDKKRCAIQHGNSNYQLAALDYNVAEEELGSIEIDYYTISAKNYKELLGDDAKLAVFNSNVFSLNYALVAHCLSKGIDWKFQNICISNNRMIACDLARGASVSFVFDGAITLHKKVCDCFLSLNNKNVTVFYNNSTIIGMIDRFVFASSISDDYPIDAIGPIIDRFKEQFAIKITFDAVSFSEKLSRALLFADQDSNAVDVLIKADKIEISVDNNSRATEEIKLFKYEGPDDLEALSLDGKGLLECLKKCSDEVSWVTNNSNDMQYVSDGTLLQFFLGLSG